MSDRGLTWIAWLALIVSIIALIMAWMAYNRTGEDLENRVQQEVQNAWQATENTVTE